MQMMTTTRSAQLGPGAGARALQAMGLVGLTALLVLAFSSGKDTLVLQAVPAGIGALWLIYRPHWGVWVILALSLSDFSPAILGIRYLGIPYLVSAVLMVPLVMAILRDREIWVWRIPQIKILLAIGLLFVASTLWGSFANPVSVLLEMDQTAKMLQQFFTRLVFLILFLYFITTADRLKRTVWLVLGLAVASALSAIVPILGGGSLAHRAEATFGFGQTSNYLAFFSVFGSAFLWFYRADAQGRGRTALVLPLVFLLLIAALFTGSRNGFVTMMVLALLILKEQTGWSATQRVRSLLFAGSVVLLLALLVPTAQFMRATSFDPTAAAPGQGSLHARIGTLYAALEMTASNPVLGIGIGNFRWMHQEMYGNDREPHNAYLWALTSGGVGALALYLLLFFVTYRMLRRLEQRGPPELLWVAKGLKVNLILFLVFCVFADLWLSDLLYLMLGLAVAMTRVWQQGSRARA